jgi:flagellar basal-body rod protein FlgC
MLSTLDISTSGLIAQRQRMNTIAGNIANLNTTRDEHGNVSPFQRRLVTFQADQAGTKPAPGGVGVAYKIEVDSQKPPRQVHEPGHPDADAAGYVAYPDISLTSEFVNAVEASRAYEANVAAMDITKTMYSQTLKILA